ncbi:unnamed protein product [Boreogadus saida]
MQKLQSAAVIQPAARETSLTEGEATVACTGLQGAKRYFQTNAIFYNGTRIREVPHLWGSLLERCGPATEPATEPTNTSVRRKSRCCFCTATRGQTPTERPAPQLSPRRERGNSGRGGTLVGGTFCGVRDEEIQATAQGHAGSTEGPCLEIRHSETSEAQRRLWRKENPDSELFNGSQIPIPK